MICISHNLTKLLWPLIKVDSILHLTKKMVQSIRHSIHWWEKCQGSKWLLSREMSSTAHSTLCTIKKMSSEHWKSAKLIWQSTVCTTRKLSTEHWKSAELIWPIDKLTPYLPLDPSIETTFTEILPLSVNLILWFSDSLLQMSWMHEILTDDLPSGGLI